LGLVKRFYSGAINLAPLNGQAIFICGPAGCGKNFISELVLPASMAEARRTRTGF